MLALCAIGAYEHLPSTPEAEATMKTLRRALANRTAAARLLEAKILLDGAWSRTDGLARWLVAERPSLAYLSVAVAQPRSQPDRVLLAHRSSVAGRWRTYACLDAVLTALDDGGSRASTVVLDACVAERRLEAVLARHPTVRVVTALQTVDDEYPAWPAGCAPHHASPMAQFISDVLRAGPSWVPQLSVEALADMLVMTAESTDDDVHVATVGASYDGPLMWSGGSVRERRDDGPDRMASSSRFNLVHLAAAEMVRQAHLGARRETPAPLHNPFAPRHKQADARDSTDWVWIPAGTAVVGSTDDEPDSLPEERPQHAISLPRFAIARTPVSIAEFRAFQHACAPRDADLITMAAPAAGDDRTPVTGVNWFDAIAYCQWLEDCLRTSTSLPEGYAVDLPSEPEWERAARSDLHQAYPWGDTFDSSRANVRSSGIGTVVPSGSFSPGGDSPFGIQDMAGNVFEWTRSAWGHSRHNPDFAYPYDPTDGREYRGAHINARRVVRGGAYYYDDNCVRVATRNVFMPWIRHPGGGFRVVLRRGNWPV